MSDLFATPISIDDLPFRNEDGVMQFGRLFYVHHPLTIDSINEMLNGKGLRPSTVADMTSFYEAYGLIISQVSSIEMILATQEVGGIKGEERIPCIKRNEEGIVSFATYNSSGRFVTDHAGIYVLAIVCSEANTSLKEERSERSNG